MRDLLIALSLICIAAVACVAAPGNVIRTVTDAQFRAYTSNKRMTVAQFAVYTSAHRYASVVYNTYSSGTGAPGRGITSIMRSAGNGSPGTYDTYTIIYTDATTSDFAVYNGANGATGATGPTGAQGPRGYDGPAGPNAVSTATTSTLTGMLKGSGGYLAAAILGSDYLDGTTAVTSFASRTGAVTANASDYASYYPTRGARWSFANISTTSISISQGDTAQALELAVSAAAGNNTLTIRPFDNISTSLVVEFSTHGMTVNGTQVLSW